MTDNENDIFPLEDPSSLVLLLPCSPSPFPSYHNNVPQTNTRTQKHQKVSAAAAAAHTPMQLMHAVRLTASSYPSPPPIAYTIDTLFMLID